MIGHWFFTRFGQLLRSESNYVTLLPYVFSWIVTDIQTDGRTYGRTDTASYRDARTHLKRRPMTSLYVLAKPMYCYSS